MEAITKMLTAQFLGVVFLIMGLVGGIFVLVPALIPPFHAHLWPGLVILICALVFSLWRGASKIIKTSLATIALVLGIWLIVNVTGAIVTPAMPTLEDLVSALATGDVMALAPLLTGIGAVGGAIAAIGAIFGIMSARMG